MAGVYVYKGKIKKLLVAAWRWAKPDEPVKPVELRDTPDADQKLGPTPHGDQPAVNRLPVERVDSPPANEAPGTPYDEEIGVDTSGRV